MGRLKSFRRLSFNEKLLFAEALILHLKTGLLLKIIPFRWIPRLFGSPQSTVGNQQSEIIELIRTATQRAGGVSPWKNKCLVSSLAARCMFRRRNIRSQVHLGVAKNAEGITIAHAWLEVEKNEIVGKNGDYHDLYMF